MMNCDIKLSLCLLALLSLTACSGGTSDNSAAYIGEWETGCTASQLPQAPDLFITYSYRFDATSWHSVQGNYFDENCTVQMQGSLETVLSKSYTTTLTADYTDISTRTTSDGLVANVLNSTITAQTSTSDNPILESDSAVGNSAELLLHVSDTNVLYLDGVAFGINAEPGSLLLTLPFSRKE